jgi:primase-polymerase (primpol)-like protein
MSHEDMECIHTVQERVKWSKLAQSGKVFDIFGRCQVPISEGHRQSWIECFLGFARSLQANFRTVLEIC